MLTTHGYCTWFVCLSVCLSVCSVPLALGHGKLTLYIFLQNSDHFWPGLGGTDRDYAWTLISFSLFEAATLPLATAMMDVVPYTVLILIMLFLYGVSGAVYATATDVWMVILARCLMGCASLLLSSIVYTYIGEMGTTMDRARNKKGKLPRKNLLYLLAILGATFANALLLGEKKLM